jgi:hypothetical protein
MKACLVRIASPWRTGMSIGCQLTDGHEGLHHATVGRTRRDLVEVNWSGQHDRFTDQEIRRQSKFEWASAP